MKILNPTFDYLSNLSEATSVTLLSEYPSLNGLTATHEKEDRGFKLTIPRINTYPDMAKDFDNRYGLLKPFSLPANGQQYFNAKGADHVNLTLNNLSAECKLWEFQNNIQQETRHFYRMVLPKAYNDTKDPYKFITSDRLETDNNSSAFAGLIRFSGGETKFELFNCNHEKSYYLLLDTVEPIFFDQFKLACEATIFSLGFITGHLHRNEMFILQASDVDFKNITGCFFNHMKDTVTSGMEVVSPFLFKVQTGTEPPDSYLDRQAFSSLVSTALRDKRLLRALQIISEGNSYPMEIKASVYSVALETVKNIIIEDHQEKLNPFKNKAVASKTIKQFVEQINTLENEAFNSKITVVNKLQQLNQITNKDSFLSAFKVFKFALHDSDKEALAKRNDFLHGRIPFENETDAEQQLKFVSYKMHFLVSILILKYVGFKGWIRNSAILLAALNRYNNRPDEALFVK